MQVKYRPTDPGHCRPVVVDFGEAANQRMRTNDIRDRVIGPLLIGRLVDAAKLLVVTLIGPAVREPAAVLALVLIHVLLRT